MADKLIIDCSTGIAEKRKFTEEEKQKQLEEQTEVKVQYPQISEEKEQLALLTIENEELKDRIKTLENKILGGK